MATKRTELYYKALIGLAERLPAFNSNWDEETKNTWRVTYHKLWDGLFELNEKDRSVKIIHVGKWVIEIYRKERTP